MIVTSHDEVCPISEQLLFSLYDAAKLAVDGDLNCAEQLQAVVD
jgi:hypothetical protein